MVPFGISILALAAFGTVPVVTAAPMPARTAMGTRTNGDLTPGAYPVSTPTQTNKGQPDALDSRDYPMPEMPFDIFLDPEFEVRSG
ncbi:hypothetical protein PG991_008848 [Apiospora marii]|uniref:Uncharacterized protein n=1 Tax=Apiospora marii TaxID=335849 RepID=A0ABR1RLX7_9PEZI